eukprot:5661543-Amphidinium_carterae.1
MEPLTPDKISRSRRRSPSVHGEAPPLSTIPGKSWKQNLAALIIVLERSSLKGVVRLCLLGLQAGLK